MEYFKTDSNNIQRYNQKHNPEEVEEDAPKNNNIAHIFDGCRKFTAKSFN
jgi:hypothetical protein